MSLTEYLAATFSDDGLDELQSVVNSEIAVRQPSIDEFRTTYERPAEIDVSSMSPEELDALEATVNEQLAFYRAGMTEIDVLSTDLVSEPSMVAA